MKHKWRVEKREKLALFLAEKLGESGKKVRKLLEQNACKINGKIERFGSVWVEKGSVVEFAMPSSKESQWQVLLDHDDFCIMNKPVHWVCSEKNAQQTFPGYFLVHRLDKDTTGALLLAKTLAAKEALMKLFQTRAVEKEYLALVDGKILAKQGTVDNFLAKKGSFQGQTIWGSAPKGDRAITHWQVLDVGQEASFVLCRPLTGRTHQIRVHMAEMHHPLLIDRQYAHTFKAKISAARPMLHAYRLAFAYEGKQIEATAPIPEDFQNCLNSLGLHL